MVLRQIRIGPMENILQYDDADFAEAVETDQPIKAGTPVVGNDVLRLDDVGVGAGDVIGPGASTDNAIVRFSGPTGKVIQNSLILIDDAGKITLLAATIGDGGVTNYAEFAADGELTLHGTARALNSRDIHTTIPRRPLANPPDEGSKDGFHTLDFDDTIDESVYIDFHLPHSYANAGAVNLHLDFFVDTAPAAPANVVWGCEYKKIGHGDIFDFTAGTTTVTTIEAITIGTPANDSRMHYSSNMNLVTTGWTYEDSVYMRLFRDADHASDTFVGDVRIIGHFHIGYIKNKLGLAT